jgi:hypothetical protein
MGIMVMLRAPDVIGGRSTRATNGLALKENAWAYWHTKSHANATYRSAMVNSGVASKSLSQASKAMEKLRYFTGNPYRKQRRHTGSGSADGLLMMAGLLEVRRRGAGRADAIDH